MKPKEVQYEFVVVGRSRSSYYVNVDITGDVPSPQAVVSFIDSVGWLTRGENKVSHWHFPIQSEDGIVEIGIERYDLNDDADLRRLAVALYGIITRQ